MRVGRLSWAGIWIARYSTVTIRTASTARCSAARRAPAVRERLSGLSIDALKERAAAANAELYNLGITFTVYSDAKTIDRILPFDVLPRVLSAEEWRHLESGIVQRITAINLLLDDIYHDQHVLRDGIVPPDLILGNHNYRPLMRGVDVPHKAYVNICGTDIVRDEKGNFSCSRTTRGPRRGSAMSSRTGT